MTKRELEQFMPTVLENGDIRCYAHPFTLGQYKKMTGELSLFKACQRRYKDVVNPDEYYYMTPSIFDSAPDRTENYVVDENGELTHGAFNSTQNYLRISLHPAYDPISKIVKAYNATLRTLGRKGGYSAKRPLLVAPIVKVGNIEYAWLNKNECVEGEDQTMDLASRYLFNVLCDVVRKNPHATPSVVNIVAQCECAKLALKGCDDETMSLLQLGTLSHDDNYENWTEFSQPQKDEFGMICDFAKSEKDIYFQTFNDEIKLGK